MNKEQAQLYLAEQLPEQIIFNPKNPVKFFWRNKEDSYGSRPEILETEWQQITLWVEEKMTDEQYTYYDQILYSLDELNGRYASSNYTTRATAMKESGL